MTMQELNDLISKGAGQPGVREVEEMMRLCWALDEQARELFTISAVETVSTVASDTGSVRPAAAQHADMG